jgi:hypothetical protein
MKRLYKLPRVSTMPVRTIIGEAAVRYSQCFRNMLKILESKNCRLSLRLAKGKNQVNFQATRVEIYQEGCQSAILSWVTEEMNCNAKRHPKKVSINRGISSHLDEFRAGTRWAVRNAAN